MTAIRKLLVAALTLSLPVLASAQTAEPAKPAETQPAAPATAPATPAPAAQPAAPAAAKPAEPTVKVTPYGFVLFNAFWNDKQFAARDYPATVTTTNNGGSFLGSARQSRFGVRLALKDDNWTGAEFAGTVEFDFKAGHLGTASSTGWNAGVMRLRIASATALWKTPYGSWSLLAGQDYGLVNPLFAESASWVADPVFWQAGNYWRRSPQLRLTFAQQFGILGLNVAAAALSPADSVPASPTGAVPGSPGFDFGAGGASRTPDWEARAALSAKIMPDVSGTVGVGFHTNTRRYFAMTANEVDETVTGFGVDADVSVTKFLQVKGEYYSAEGLDDTYNAIGPGTRFELGAGGAAPTATSPALNVASDGFWAQAILKPLPQIWVVAGYGQATADEADLKKVIPATDATAANPQYNNTRQENTQTHVGVILNAGKFWRVAVEAIMTETTYLDGRSFDGTAYALSSMFRF